jgi:integrase
MASMYKKPIFTRDPITGKKVKAKSKKWWGRFRDYRGLEKRVPLARDKAAAKTMLDELVRKAERQAAGCADPYEEHLKRPLKDHIHDFQQHLKYKGNTAKHVFEVSGKVRKIAAGCKWKFIKDFSASQVQKYLSDRRDAGTSIQTSNHYLRAIKQFSRWLVLDRRNHDDPLSHLAMLNVKVDRRHDRRALSAEEFSLLVDAAMNGPEVIRISGVDRAMMYILSAWTGYRKAEIGSLTKRSIKLDDATPTVTVAAAYSKRKRQDTQVLHPEVAFRLRAWLERKKSLSEDDLLFPVSAKVPGGIERHTSKMMRVDLNAARKKWIEEGKSPKEKAKRERADFLMYKNNTGQFADFHSNRHTFITNLEHAGISPRTAQTLARHSDIRLTMGVYTHIGLHDQTSAIELLPAPPTIAIPNQNTDIPVPNRNEKGSRPTLLSEISDLRQLDSIWATLPDNIKADILSLVNTAAKSTVSPAEAV